jgi:hypothetical protein
MCKTSGKFVNINIFIHNKYTLDINYIFRIVTKGRFIQIISTFFIIVFQSIFNFIKNLINTFTMFPHKLLLLSLSINLNIINKNLRNGVY